MLKCNLIGEPVCISIRILVTQDRHRPAMNFLTVFVDVNWHCMWHRLLSR